MDGRPTRPSTVTYFLQSPDGTVLPLLQPGACAGFPLGFCPGGKLFSELVVRAPPLVLGEGDVGPETSPHADMITAASAITNILTLIAFLPPTTLQVNHPM